MKNYLIHAFVVLAFLANPALAQQYPANSTDSNGHTNVTTPVAITGTGGTITSSGLPVNCLTGCTVTPDTPITTGAISSNGATVTLTTTGGYASFAATVTGTWAGAIQILGSQDCVNFSVTTALPLANGVPSNVISTNGVYQGSIAGLKCIQLKGLSIVSGTANISLAAGAGVSSVMQDNAPWIFGGYASGSSSSAITATVKSASTAPAATDTSLVVGLSPNGNQVQTVPTTAAVASFQQTCTASAVQLPNQAYTNGLVITALSTNTGTDYVGGASVTTSNGYPLKPGQSISYNAANSNQVYLVCSNNTDVVAGTGN